MIATAKTHIKSYEDSERCAKARIHYEWLLDLGSRVRLPALVSYGPRHLVFEHLGDHHPDPHDLDLLADALGILHAAAYTHCLHGVPLDQPYRTGDLVIPDFITPRRTALQTVDLPVRQLPAAIYKDANIRNFLLTDDGAAIVDFDDLTLAPFGYDLAKLVVTTAMTHGRLSADVMESALGAYNNRTACLGPATECSLDQLFVFAEIHHLLTARYLHQHGYRYAWPDVRPIAPPSWAT